jgi:hypothetical protein
MPVSVGHRTALMPHDHSWLAVGRGQKSMQRCYHLRALADGGSNPLDRSRTDIADGKDAVPTCFQRPAANGGVRASQYESLLVKGYTRPV